MLLIEARRIGWGASGRNGGQMIPGMRWPASELVASFGEEHGKRLVELGLAASASVRRRIARHAIACDLVDGHFHAAWKPAHLAQMKREQELLARVNTTVAPVGSKSPMRSGIVTTVRYHANETRPFSAFAGRAASRR